MTFGLILSFLEGRRQTEAMSAALCASFIVSSGVVKSVGVWLMQDRGASEFVMPMLTGLIFFVPLLISVWLLQQSPPPDCHDRELRAIRAAMTSEDRRKFIRAFWPGLSLLVLVYILLTVVRTIRDDFAVELWRDMGIDKAPSVFTSSEMWVGLVVTALCGLTIWVKDNWLAIRLTIGLMAAAFMLVLGASWLQRTANLSPFLFMVGCGIGLYIPYVAFHTTIFERLIAVSRMPSNLGFLMYLADSIGYLGYALLIVLRTQVKELHSMLPLFHGTLLISAITSIVCLAGAWFYFHQKLGSISLTNPIAPPPAVGDTELSEAVVANG